MPHIKRPATCSVCLFGIPPEGPHICHGCIDVHRRYHCSNRNKDNKPCCDPQFIARCNCQTVKVGEPCPYYKRNTFAARIKERLNIFK